MYTKYAWVRARYPPRQGRGTPGTFLSLRRYLHSLRIYFPSEQKSRVGSISEIARS